MNNNSDVFYPLPYPMWDAMRNGERMMPLLQLVPVQYTWDFKQILKLLTEDALHICRQLREHHSRTHYFSAKEVGEYIRALPEGQEHIRSLLFYYRNNKGDILKGKPRTKLFEYIKPVNNKIIGYFPSRCMEDLMAEVLRNAV